LVGVAAFQGAFLGVVAFQGAFLVGVAEVGVVLGLDVILSFADHAVSEAAVGPAVEVAVEAVHYTTGLELDVHLLQAAWV